MQLTLTLLDGFLGLFAVLTANRERQRPETLFSDFLGTLEAVAVRALLEAGERVVDLIERLGLHLDERELDVFLDVGFRALDGIINFGQLRDFAGRADIAHLALNLGLQFAPTTLEHLLEFAITSRPAGLAGFRIHPLHDAAPSVP